MISMACNNEGYYGSGAIHALSRIGFDLFSFSDHRPDLHLQQEWARMHIIEDHNDETVRCNLGG